VAGTILRRDPVGGNSGPRFQEPYKGLRVGALSSYRRDHYATAIAKASATRRSVPTCITYSRNAIPGMTRRPLFACSSALGWRCKAIPSGTSTYTYHQWRVRQRAPARRRNRRLIPGSRHRVLSGTGHACMMKTRRVRRIGDQLLKEVGLMQTTKLRGTEWSLTTKIGGEFPMPI